MAQIQISSEDVMAYSKQVDAYANLRTYIKPQIYIRKTNNLWCVMNEINFYNALSSDLSALLNQTKNIVSNEEFVYVNQKVSRIQYLIQIQMQGIMNRERR